MDEAVRPPAPEFTFTLRGALIGARRSLPLAAGVFAYGIPWGVLARAAGLTPLEALLMSALVFAGTAQFVTLGLWAVSPPLPALVLTTLVVNLRFVLMGMVAARWLERAPRVRAHLSMFLLTDEVWAVTAADVARGGRNAALLPGGGALLWLAWLSSTTIGRLAGTLIVDPAALGLDVVLVGTLIALLVGMWSGRRSALPWLAAGATAVVASRVLPGSWYIGAGCLVGSLLAAALYDR